MWLGGRISSVTCRRILSTERACVQTQRNERSVRVPGLGLRQHVGAASGGDGVTGKRGDAKWKLWKQRPEPGETAPVLLRSVVLG